MGREIVRISQERFQGWGCSARGWTFNPSTPLVGRSIEEMKRRFEVERDKEFRSHLCAAYPMAKKPAPR
jgi:hypothetical protein